MQRAEPMANAGGARGEGEGALGRSQAALAPGAPGLLCGSRGSLLLGFGNNTEMGTLGALVLVGWFSRWCCAAGGGAGWKPQPKAGC